jgi:hypothetical protein
MHMLDRIQSPDDLIDMLASLKCLFLVPDQDDLPMGAESACRPTHLEKDGIFGVYIRRNLLAYNQMMFGAVSSFFEAVLDYKAEGEFGGTGGGGAGGRSFSQSLSRSGPGGGGGGGGGGGFPHSAGRGRTGGGSGGGLPMRMHHDQDESPSSNASSPFASPFESSAELQVRSHQCCSCRALERRWPQCSPSVCPPARCVQRVGAPSTLREWEGAGSYPSLRPASSDLCPLPSALPPSRPLPSRPLPSCPPAPFPPAPFPLALPPPFPLALPPPFPPAPFPPARCPLRPPLPSAPSSLRRSKRSRAARWARATSGPQRFPKSL